MLRLSTLLLILSVPVCGQTTLTLTPDRDNSLYEDPTGALSNGVGEFLYLGYTGNLELRRALVHFDLGAIPAGATLLSASLGFFVDRAGRGPDTVDLHRVNESWGEGTSLALGGGGRGTASTTGDATWIHRSFPNQPWIAPGGSFELLPSDSTMAPFFGAFSFSGPGLVSDLQAWVDGTRPNHGWVLRGTEFLPLSARRVGSRESQTPSRRPTLTITYASPVTAGVVLTGTGCGPSGTTPFTLDAVGLPSLGNAAFQLTLRDGPALSGALLYLSTAVTPASPTPFGGGCSIWLDLPGATALLGTGLSPVGPLPLSASGALDLGVPIPASPTLNGQTFHLQALAPSPLAAASGGFFATNALSFTIGP